MNKRLCENSKPDLDPSPALFEGYMQSMCIISRYFNSIRASYLIKRTLSFVRGHNTRIRTIFSLPRLDDLTSESGEVTAILSMVTADTTDWSAVWVLRFFHDV